LLERCVVLLVDHEEPETVDGGEHRRTGSDDDPRLAARDPRALVASLGICERGVQHGNALAEARTEAADGLRRERDLRDEHDDTAAAFQRSCRSLEVHLGLATPRRPLEEHVAALPVERGDDSLDGVALRLRQRLRLELTAERIACGRRAQRPAPRALERGDQGEGPRRGRAVVVGEPERELDERRRYTVDDRACVRDVDARRRRHSGLDDDAADSPRAERDRDDVALPDLVGHRVGERPRERARRNEWEHRRQRHAGERSAGRRMGS
jgi:hypothetical protein